MYAERGDVVNEIDEIAKEKGAPRSQVMEEMLRDWLLKSKRKEIEKDIESYYLSLTEKEKKEDQEWAMIAAESANHNNRQILTYKGSFCRQNKQ